MVQSTWLTAVRTRRLLDILAAIPSRPPGIPVDDARLRLWRICGGSIDDVRRLIDVLIGAELVKEERGAFQRTRAGQRVVARRNTEGPRPLGLALLRAGYFHDQARLMLDMAAAEQDGNLSCPTRTARQRCPQLVGVLQFWPDVIVTSHIHIPEYLARELGTVWALLPPSSPDEAISDAIRRNIGNRGEAYSYQLELLNAADRSHIVWVARDDSDLGYDIEDRSVNPRRRIEVKASGDIPVRFLMSDNEYRKSRDDPTSYEVHFWGGLDLNVDPAEEYTRLRRQGYPLIFTDLPARISAGEFEAQPTKWRLTKIR
jgi:Domain of unknown function (DUF3883)